jgi:hypothetical protein
MIRWTRSLLAAGAVLGTLAVVPVAGAAGRADSGTSYVAITHQAGKIEFSAGNNVDKVLGRSAVTYALQVLPSSKAATYTVSAKQVTLYTRNGSLSGTATATLVVAGDGTATVKNGKLKLTSGAGAQAGHRLIATFHGTGNIGKGTYKFQYAGTYS